HGPLVGVGQIELAARAGDPGYAGRVADLEEFGQLDHLTLQAVLHPEHNGVELAGLNIVQQPPIFLADLLTGFGCRNVVVDVMVNDGPPSPFSNLQAVLSLTFNAEFFSFPVTGDSAVNPG